MESDGTVSSVPFGQNAISIQESPDRRLAVVVHEGWEKATIFRWRSDGPEMSYTVEIGRKWSFYGVTSSEIYFGGPKGLSVFDQKTGEKVISLDGQIQSYTRSQGRPFVANLWSVGEVFPGGVRWKDTPDNWFFSTMSGEDGDLFVATSEGSSYRLRNDRWELALRTFKGVNSFRKVGAFRFLSAFDGELLVLDDLGRRVRVVGLKLREAEPQRFKILDSGRRAMIIGASPRTGYTAVSMLQYAEQCDLSRLPGAKAHRAVIEQGSFLSDVFR